jgi:hypothetical protein
MTSLILLMLKLTLSYGLVDYLPVIMILVPKGKHVGEN